jgi:hypothetical protein
MVCISMVTSLACSSPLELLHHCEGFIGTASLKLRIENLKQSISDLEDQAIKIHSRELECQVGCLYQLVYVFSPLTPFVDGAQDAAAGARATHQVGIIREAFVTSARIMTAMPFSCIYVQISVQARKTSGDGSRSEIHAEEVGLHLVRDEARCLKRYCFVNLSESFENRKLSWLLRSASGKTIRMRSLDG